MLQVDDNTVFFPQEKLYSELMAPRRHLDPGMSDKKQNKQTKKRKPCLRFLIKKMTYLKIIQWHSKYKVSFVV